MEQLYILKRIKRVHSEYSVLRALRKSGFNKSEIELIPFELADRQPKEGEDYYYYTGPLDDKTREFCRLMLNIDKVFSKEQIDYISQELGYSVLEYCGSYNCRHNWVRFRGKRIFTPNPTQREIRKLINRGIEA